MADTPWDSINPFAGGLTKDMEFIVKVGDKNYKIPLSNITLSEVDTSDAKKNLPLNSSAVNGALADYSRATMTDYNLDNYLTEGNYCCIGNDTNYTNCPIGYNSNFSLEVKRVMSNDNKYVIQIFRPYGDSKQFQRANYYTGQGATGTEWTDWKQFITETDLNGALTNYTRYLSVGELPPGQSLSFRTKGYYANFSFYGTAINQDRIGGISVGEGGDMTWYNTINGILLPSISGTWNHTTQSSDITLTNNTQFSITGTIYFV